VLLFLYLDLVDEIFASESSWRERYQVVSDVGDGAVSKLSMGKHVSAKELASYLSLHVKTVLKMARAGILTASASTWRNAPASFAGGLRGSALLSVFFGHKYRKENEWPKDEIDQDPTLSMK